MSDELLELADQADRADQAGPSQPGAATPPGAAPAGTPEISPNVGAIAFLLTTFRTIGGVALGVQSLAVTLDDQKVQLCAATLAPVADKYGIDLSGAFSGPEATAIMVAGPILWEAARQLNLELKAKRAKPVDGERVTPGEDTAAPQTAVDG